MAILVIHQLLDTLLLQVLHLYPPCDKILHFSLSDLVLSQGANNTAVVCRSEGQVGFKSLSIVQKLVNVNSWLQPWSIVSLVDHIPSEHAVINHTCVTQAAMS
jgi:hypothetical protein